MTIINKNNQSEMEDSAPKDFENVKRHMVMNLKMSKMFIKEQVRAENLAFFRLVPLQERYSVRNHRDLLKCKKPISLFARKQVLEDADYHFVDKHEMQSSDFYNHLKKTALDSYKKGYIDGGNVNLEYILDLAESIYIFMDILRRKKPGESIKQTVLFGFAVLIKMRFKGSVCKNLVEASKKYILSIFSGTEIQSDDIFQDARDIMQTWKNIRESAFVKKIYKCVTYALSLSLFDKVGISLDSFGYSKIEQATLKKKFYSKSDFVYVVLDTILFVSERGYQVFKTGDPSTILHTGGNYQKIFENCMLLKRQSNLLTNPEDHGFTESSFRANLDSIIEKLSSINKHSYRLESYEKQAVKIQLDDMLMLRDDLTTRREARKSRRAPFGLLIYGDSGIGKTMIVEMLFYYFCKLWKLNHGSEFKYTKNPKSKYWDGYVSSCHTIVLDDIASEHPNMQDSSSVDEILQIMNNTAYCPDQAALSDKGRTPMKAKLCLATTNRKDINAHHFYTTPSAVQRRFPYVITPRVKHEFLDDRNMLNSESVPRQPFPDCWTWTVEKVVPIPINLDKTIQQNATMEKILDNATSSEFWHWLSIAAEQHKNRQNLFSESVRMMETSKLCLCCSVPEELCATLQSDDTYIPMFGIIAWFIHLWDLFYNSDFIFCLRWFVICLYIQIRIILGLKRARDLTKEFVVDLQNPDFWKRMGDRMAKKLEHPKLFLGIASIIAAGGMIYKLMGKHMLQGASDEVGTVPVAELDGRENVWYKNDLSITGINFSRQSSSAKGEEFSAFKKRIAKNCLSFRVQNLEKGPNVYRPGKLVCLGGHVYMTNCHIIPQLGNGAQFEIFTMSNKDGINTNHTFIVTESELIRHPEYDLVFVLLRQIPPKPRIVQYFMKGSGSGVFKGAYISREESGYIHEVNAINIRPSQNFNLAALGIRRDVLLSVVSERTKVGFCGSPLLIETAFGYAIAGIHVALLDYTDQGVALRIDGNMLTEIYSNFTNHNVESGDFDLLSSVSSERVVGELHKKSCFRYLEEGVGTIHGSFKDFRGNTKSSVEATPMSHYLVNHGYKIKYFKPEMKSWVPWHIAARDLTKPVSVLSSGILGQCALQYIDDVMANLKDAENINKMLHPLDNFTAVNGAQVAYIDKINRNTSAGNPWKKSKQYFMSNIPPKHGMLDPVEVDAEIMERVDRIMENYANNKRSNPNFCAHLKDEPVSLKKARVGKTRVFTGAPFDWTIVVRKMLLSFTRLVQNERIAFESAPGTIAQSLEWQELYDYIFHHGTDRVVAGDYKSFDKKMSPIEILAAFDVIKSFCKMSGNYTESELQIIQCIAEDTAFPVVDYNGDLITLHGSNPSGNPLTVILNSIVNCLRMRYVYMLLNPEKEVHTFKQNVNLMTYGDDNIMTVSKNCDWYNHSAISSCFERIGIGYTMADKERESVPFITVDDSSFLKRTWRYDKDVGAHVAPLDHDSIEKMLMVWNKSKSLVPEAQCAAVVASAVSEYFFYGRSVFEEKRVLLREMMINLGYEKYIEDTTFPTYRELIDRFKKSSRQCGLYADYYSDSINIQSGETKKFLWYINTFTWEEENGGSLQAQEELMLSASSTN